MPKITENGLAVHKQNYVISNNDDTQWNENCLITQTQDQKASEALHSANTPVQGY